MSTKIIPAADAGRDTNLSAELKTSAADPNECGINTYKRKTISVIMFFEWLYLLDVDRQQRKKAKVDIVRDLPLYKRKEKTSVEATDLWLPVEDAVVLKYLSYNVRRYQRQTARAFVKTLWRR